jgi:hypothetical protein
MLFLSFLPSYRLSFYTLSLISFVFIISFIQYFFTEQGKVESWFSILSSFLTFFFISSVYYLPAFHAPILYLIFLYFLPKVFACFIYFTISLLHTGTLSHFLSLVLSSFLFLFLPKSPQEQELLSTYNSLADRNLLVVLTHTCVKWGDMNTRSYLYSGDSVQLNVFPVRCVDRSNHTCHPDTTRHPHNNGQHSPHLHIPILSCARNILTFEGVRSHDHMVYQIQRRDALTTVDTVSQHENRRSKKKRNKEPIQPAQKKMNNLSKAKTRVCNKW